MYFRFSCRVQALAIRTYCHYRLGSETLRASTYEDSEAVFYLGGPHEVVVKMRNAGEDELPLPKAHKHYLVCQATGRWDPSSAQIREGFEALSEGRIPNLIESLTEDQRKLLARACSELSVAAEKAAEALRWRYGILGPHSPYSSRRSEWSFDAEQWYAFPSHSLSKLQVHVELLPTTTVHVTDNVKADTEALLSGGHTEPLSHALFREAWMEHERKNPRSALVIGVAALEAGLKKHVAALVPEAEWLVENAPTPPLVSMLKNYLPKLPAKCTFEGKVLPPPKKLLNTLDKAVQERNRVIHTGSDDLTRAPLKDWLLAIRDVLWLLDYYRGFRWALEHVREETMEALRS